MLVVSSVEEDETGRPKSVTVWDTWVHKQYRMSGDMLVTMLLSGALGMDMKVRLDATLNKHMPLIRKTHPFPENNGVLFKNFSEGADSWLSLERVQASPAEFGSDVLDYKPLRRARKEKLAGVNNLFSRYISHPKMKGSYANAPASRFELLLAGVSQDTEFTVNGDFIFEFAVPRDVCDIGVATVADAMAETYLVDAGISGEIETMRLVGTDTTKSLRLAVNKLSGLRFLHGFSYMCWALTFGSIDFSGVDAKGNPVTSLFWGISSDSCFEMRKCDMQEVEARFSSISETQKNLGYGSCYRMEVEQGTSSYMYLGADTVTSATITDKSFGSKISGLLGEFHPIGNLVGLYRSLNTSEGYARYNAPDISWAYIHLFVDTESFYGNPNVTLESLVNEVSRECISLGICTILDNCTITSLSGSVYSVYFLCPVHTDWLLNNFVNPYLKLMSQFIKGRKITRDGIWEDDHFVVVTYMAKSSFFFKFNGYYLRLNNMLPISEIEQYSLAYQDRGWYLRRAKLADTFDKYIRRVRERFHKGKEGSPSAKSAVKLNQTAVSAERVEDLGQLESKVYRSERWIPIEDYISIELSHNGKLVAFADSLSGSVFPKSFDDAERDAVANRIKRDW